MEHQWILMEHENHGREERNAKQEEGKLKNRGVKKAASCVSHILQLRYFFDNPTGQIEHQGIMNNISNIYLNPTVDEVAMIIFPKGVCAVSQLAVFSSGQPEGLRGFATCNFKNKFFTHFYDLFAFFWRGNPRRALW